MTILYADDDRDDCDLLCEALGKIDPSIRCILASNGRDALNILNENQLLPDYIFLDINMPVMDGKKCLVEIKKDVRLKEIPVIIYSTTSNQDEIDDLYSAGAISFIQKPNNFNQLPSMLNTFFSLVNVTESN
jgi:CheY-like chemotaxis protein